MKRKFNYIILLALAIILVACTPAVKLEDLSIKHQWEFPPVEDMEEKDDYNMDLSIQVKNITDKVLKDIDVRVYALDENEEITIREFKIDSLNPDEQYDYNDLLEKEMVDKLVDIENLEPKFEVK